MKRQSGITLVELMVTIAIMAILLVIGLPSYQYITESYRMSAEANNLLGDLQYARGEAIREGQGVTVCSSSNSTTATPTCSGSSSWQSGWVVFSNPTAAANPAAGTVLRVQAPFTGKVTPDTFVAGGGLSSITYNREGFATTAAGFASQLITLHDPAANSAFTRCLWVTPVGLASIQTHINNFSPFACT
jgi:type IV fimbrial biogenesis protein FimT